MFAVKSSTAVFQVRWRPMSRTTSPARIRSCPLKTTTASRRTLSVGTMSLRTVWSAHRIPPKASRRPYTAGRDFLHSSSITWEKLTSHSSRRTPGRSALTRDTSDLVVGSGLYCFCFSIIEMANRKVFFFLVFLDHVITALINKWSHFNCCKYYSIFTFCPSFYRPLLSLLGLGTRNQEEVFWRDCCWGKTDVGSCDIVCFHGVTVVVQLDHIFSKTLSSVEHNHVVITAQRRAAGNRGDYSKCLLIKSPQVWNSRSTH